MNEIRPFHMPLFTQVRGIGILRSSHSGHSRKFAPRTSYMVYKDTPDSGCACRRRCVRWRQGRTRTPCPSDSRLATRYWPRPFFLRWQRGLSFCPKEFALGGFSDKALCGDPGGLGQGLQQVRNAQVTANVCHLAYARGDSIAHNRV